METVWPMNNHQFDLSAGESIRLGAYTVTLLEIEGDAAVLEIEGPDGQKLTERDFTGQQPAEDSEQCGQDAPNQQPVLV